MSKFHEINIGILFECLYFINYKNNNTLNILIMITLRKNTAPISLFDEIFKFPFDEDFVKYPNYNIIESDSEFQIDLELAGIKKENLSIKLENDILHISAERKENKDLKFNKKNIFYGKYEKMFTIPDYVNVENINANFNDGILSIKIPKDEKMNKLKIIEIT